MKATSRIATTLSRSGIARNRTVASADAPAASLRVDRSGAPSVRNAGASSQVIVVAVMAIAALLALGAAPALAAPPTVTVDNASSVTGKTAHFSGHVNANGVDSTCDFDYVTDNEYVARNEAAKIVVSGESGDTFTIGFHQSDAESPQYTAPIPYGAPANGANSVQSALEALSNVGPGNVTVAIAQGEPGEPGIYYRVTFVGALAETNFPELLNVTVLFPPDLGHYENGHPAGFFDGTGTVPCDTNPVTGSTETAVAANLASLLPGMKYHVRIRAENTDGTAVAEASSFTTNAVAPGIFHSQAISVGEQTVTLRARVNPGGTSTTVHFEYVTQTAFEATGFATATKTPESTSIGSDNVERFVEAAIFGLESGTTYHYRTVATNSVESVASEDRSFITLASPVAEKDTCPNADRRAETGSSELPNCRSWEMVSPAEKNGGNVLAKTDLTQASADCTSSCAVSFVSLTGFGDTVGGSVGTRYLSNREPASGGNGWLTHTITPKQPPSTEPTLIVGGGEPNYPMDLSPDLDTGIFRAFAPLTDEKYVAGQLNLYARSNLREGLGSDTLVTTCPKCEETDTSLPNWDGTTGGRPLADAYTPDFQHILFESRLNLTGDGSGRPKVYQWDEGQVRLVGQVPPGEEPTCGGSGPACLVPTELSTVAGLGESHDEETPHVLSGDGTRTNFSTTPREDGYLEPPGHIYQRNSHGTASVADDTTVRLDANERVTPGNLHGVTYLTASADGHRVFFKSYGPLTDDAHEDEWNENIYMWHDEHLNDEVQKLTVQATGGQFRLVLGGQETGDLPFNATTAQVKSTLEALPAVSGAGGQIAVTGGPGDAGGTSPYTITFEGGLKETDEPTMTTVPGATPLSGVAATATVSPWVKGGGHLTLISVDHEPADDSNSFDGAPGIVGTSEDGHYVYFISGTQLLPGGPLLNGGGPRAGLYLWHDGTIEAIGYESSMYTMMRHNAINCTESGITGGSFRDFCPHTARVTPDGKSILFAAADGKYLTGYDHGDERCAGGLDQGCIELYVYHADTKQLLCASCNPTGRAASGNASNVGSEGPGATTRMNHNAHSLSDDGRYVFFTSQEALVPGDTNGVPDVYEYDGAMERTSLISSGTSKEASYFLDASADGSDVFIDTPQALSGWDSDTVLDLYDARIEGGIAEPVPHPAPCVGDSCIPSAEIPPPPPSTASASIVGPENPKPPHCSNGKVRKHGKCVKKRKGKRHHHKHRRHANTNRRAGR